jgi:putative SOS response-associated peptidase YedK
MPPIHDRRPAILDTASSQMWLDPSASPDALGSLFVPFPSDPKEARAVRSWVSNARKEGPRCLEPVG